MQANTSKSDSCRCDQNCGCCQRKQRKNKEPGFIGKRPWLLVIAAFLILFGIWGTMFTLAYQNQPEKVKMVGEE